MAIYLSSDLHGDLYRFKQLLKKIQFDSNVDQMIILGDLLDRGKQGIELLNFVRPYMAESTMLLIKGNHEFFAQLYLEQKLEAEQWRRWGGADTLKSIDCLSEGERNDLLIFLRELPHYTEIDTEKFGRTVLTHSGINADILIENQEGNIDLIQSIQQAAQTDEFKYLVSNDIHYIPAGLRKRFDKYIIVGHVPVMRINDSGSHLIYHNPSYMCIDTGAGHRTSGGKMSCYRLEDEKEFYI